jgi:outer membrane lipoprotein-sorting protein
MNSKKIEQLARQIRVKPGVINDNRILDDAADALEKTTSDMSLAAGMSLWRIIMKSRITKFAAAAAIIIAIAVSATIWNSSIPTASASATQVLTEAAKAVEDVWSIHIKARMRTLPADNFGMIGLEFDFVPIEMWKKVNDFGDVLWKVEKPGRVIVTNENSTIMLIKPNHGVKEDRPCPIGSFDTWYGDLMNVAEIIDNVLKETMERSNNQLCMYNEVLKEGTELVLETESAAQGDFTNDWCKNTFIIESDHKKVYRFDAETKLLKGFEVFVHTDKEDVLVFEVNDIEYNPQLDDSLFTIELPKDVIWYEEAKVLPDNVKYEKMTPKETAEAFFKACAEENWDEVLKFWSASRVDERLKEYLGGLEIISIGEPFKSGLYPGWFVPYEIKLQPREYYVRVSNSNSAKRFVITGQFNSKMHLQEETKWSNEPEILSDNDTYAKMSPQEAVKAFYTALSKLDFNEMQKFIPDSELKGMKGEIEEASKRGINVKEQLPTVEVGEASWSEEHSAYFVRCREAGVKKFNLAIRNDNPAKRWVVDGGI